MKIDFRRKKNRFIFIGFIFLFNLTQNMKHILLALVAFIFVSFGNNLSAQDGDDTGYDNYYDYEDSSEYEEGYEGYEDYDGYDPYGEEEKPKKPEKKPYVRIVMPYDTITELITYTGIVEQQDSYYDSLYLRAKRYLMNRFSLKDKDFKETAIEMDKIIMTLNLPYEVPRNKFVKENVGNLEFKLALRFKDGKYKYVIDHLKHVMPPNNSGSTQFNYAYLEYYMSHEKNIIYNDQLLRAADKQINSLIGEIKLALKEPVIIDEDDW